jgi:Tol biopolymer transport system component
VLGAVLTLMLLPASAGATFPGDNGRIAFQNDTLGGIYTIDEDGSDRDKLADGFEPSWSPSGKRMVFVKETGPLDDTEVFTMKANGKDKHRITHDNVYEWEPVYSPDAKQLAYRTGKFRSAEGKLYVSDADGSHRKQLANGQNPDWSVGVDGAKDGLIAYSGESTDPCFTELELFTVKPNGNGKTLLPFGCNTATMPSWSPDGGQLAFSSYPPVGNSDIYIGTEDGETKLTDLGPHDEGAAWSPDETKVAFGDRDNGLYVVAVAAPLAEVAVPNTVDVDGAQPAWQPK